MRNIQQEIMSRPHSMNISIKLDDIQLTNFTITFPFYSQHIRPNVHLIWTFLDEKRFLTDGGGGGRGP